MTILEVADEITKRLKRIFLKDEKGRRPVYGLYPQMQDDPAFRDYVPFHEYFDGDSGRGVGASHQTGWTGLIAKLMQPRVDIAGEFPCLSKEELEKLTRTSKDPKK